MKPELAALALALILVPAPARAERYFDFRGTWLLAGLSTGYQLGRGDDGGGTLGGELSIVYLDDNRQGQELHWWGGYLEVEKEYGPGTTRVSLGPELGRDFFGADLGYVVAFGDDAATRHGVSARGFLSIGLLSLYLRFEALAGDNREVFGEIGVLIKLPIPLSARD